MEASVKPAVISGDLKKAFAAQRGCEVEPEQPSEKLAEAQESIQTIFTEVRDELETHRALRLRTAEILAIILEDKFVEIINSGRATVKELEKRLINLEERQCMEYHHTLSRLNLIGVDICALSERLKNPSTNSKTNAPPRKARPRVRRRSK